MHPGLWIACGGFSAMTGVGIRASLSHADAAAAMTPRLHALMAANDMHLLHSLALIVVGICLRSVDRRRLLNVAGGLFAAGLVLFSGVIYSGAAGMGLGFLTPIGGLAFMMGWLMVAIWAVRDWRIR